MVSTPAQFAAYRIKNQTRKCFAEGCEVFRHRTSNYCQSHDRHNRHFGHPLAVPITRGTLDYHRFKFTQFIDRHQDTDQVALAVELCDDLLEHGLPHDVPKWRERQLACRRGDVDRRIADLKALHVTGREILDAAGGVWRLALKEPRVLPDDVRLTYRLGVEVLKTRPYPKRLTPFGNEKTCVPGGRPRKVIGEYIRRHLGVFFTRCYEAMEAEAQATLDQAETLAIQFDIAPINPEGN